MLTWKYDTVTTGEADCDSKQLYLLGRDVQRDGPEVHLLVGLDAGEDEKQTCGTQTKFIVKSPPALANL